MATTTIAMEDVRPFACTEPGCNATYRSKQHLQRHVKTQHGSGFVCPVKECGQSFRNAATFAAHKRSHTGEVLVCKVCQSTFTQTCTLKIHAQSQHPTHDLQDILSVPFTIPKSKNDDEAGPSSKTCSVCKQTLSIQLFHVATKGPTKGQAGSECRRCHERKHVNQDIHAAKRRLLNDRSICKEAVQEHLQDLQARKETLLGHDGKKQCKCSCWVDLSSLTDEESNRLERGFARFCKTCIAGDTDKTRNPVKVQYNTQRTQDLRQAIREDPTKAYRIVTDDDGNDIEQKVCLCKVVEWKPLDDFLDEQGNEFETCSTCRAGGRRKYANWSVDQYARKYMRTVSEQRKKSWDLSLEEAIAIMVQPCFYCGETDARGFNGIDRLDNRKGYSQTNTTSACMACNYMKGILDPQTFIERCTHIYKSSIGDERPFPHLFPSNKGLATLGEVQRRAAKAGVTCDLHWNDFSTLQRAKCSYCKSASASGWDRIDPDGDYTKDNVTPACRECNFMKWKFEVAVFFHKCRNVCTHALPKLQELPTIPRVTYVRKYKSRS
jgi:hypothetical protein